jgi:putative aldouronate transport system permease protein
MVVYSVCIMTILVIVYPLYFIVIASFSNPNEVMNGHVWLLPKGITFKGYETIFEDVRIWTGYRTTIIIASVGTLLSLAITIPAAYSLSRKDFMLRNPVMFFFVITMFFNGGLIPTYLTIKSLHLVNTIWVMIFPFSMNVFFLIITRTFFESSIPSELLDSAKVDGCSNGRFFFTIVLPLSKAIIAVILLYYIVARWNEYFTALIYIRDSKLYPLQLILRDILVRNQAFSTGEGVHSGDSAQQVANLIKYGVIIVSTLPVLIIYPFIQKYFEKGVMIGAIKG